jgi:hypothetical protein
MSYCLIDTSNIIYQVYFRNYKWYNPLVHKSETLIPFLTSKIIELITPAIQPGFIPILLFDKKKDSKYWRQEFIENHADFYEKLWADPSTGLGMNTSTSKEIDSKYKGGRLKSTDYNPVLEFTRQAAERLKASYLWLEEPGLEADDWAGLFVKYKPENVLIDLVTVDRDWAALAREGVRWVNMLPKSRYTVEYSEQVVKYFQAKLHSSIKDPFEAFEWKRVKGERGDNLLPGCHIELIDLINHCAPISYGFEHCHTTVKNFYENYNSGYSSH